MAEKLRESENSVIVEGYLNLKDLKAESKNDREYIRGTLEVRVDENNIVPINVFANKFKKDGGENKVYKSLLTVMSDYVDATMVECDNPEKAYLKADKIKITGGQIQVDSFVTRDGEIVNPIKYRTNFIKRVTDETKFNPQAKFKIELYIRKLLEEIRDEEETGRGFVDGYFVGYDGMINPLRLTAEKKIWKQIEAKLEEEETIVFWGDIENTTIVNVKTDSALIGEDNETVITSTRKERIITGAMPTEKEEYEVKDIKKAEKALSKKYAELKEDKQFEKNDNNMLGNDDNEESVEEEDGTELPWNS